MRKSMASLPDNGDQNVMVTMCNRTPESGPPTSALETRTGPRRGAVDVGFPSLGRWWMRRHRNVQLTSLSKAPVRTSPAANATCRRGWPIQPTLNSA